jgi:hypothetical protein
VEFLAAQSVRNPAIVGGKGPEPRSAAVELGYDGLEHFMQHMFYQPPPQVFSTVIFATPGGQFAVLLCGKAVRKTRPASGVLTFSSRIV